MKKFIVSLFIIAIFVFSPSPASAFKKRVWSVTTATTTSRYPWVSPKIQRARNGITLSFGNLSVSKSFSYELTYLGNGIEQGVFGSANFADTGASTSRFLYFGTCSHNVCTAHRNITNARLVVSFKLNSGKTLRKTYRINF